MKKVEVFDPPMCCSTGVCGPSVDPALARFAADLHWLANQRIAVERYNLAQQPQAFAANEVVKAALKAVRKRVSAPDPAEWRGRQQGLLPDAERIGATDWRRAGPARVQPRRPARNCR